MWYGSYDDYKQAMVRWAALCAQLPFVPPHPTQYTDLLGLSLLKEKKQEAQAEQTASAPQAVEVEAASTALNLWDELPGETQQLVRASVNKVLTGFRKNEERFKTSIAPLLGKVHGTLPYEGVVDPHAGIPRYLHVCLFDSHLHCCVLILIVCLAAASY